MTYQHCPRCRLAVPCRAIYLPFSNCPRCIARAAIASPMFSSPLDAMALRAAERERLAASAADEPVAPPVPAALLGNAPPRVPRRRVLNA